MALDMSKISVAAFLNRANKGASAKRCLFGPVNHEENTRFLREQLAMQERESKAKWNFDFRTETPVSGKFQWEEVKVSDENQVPVAYAMPQLCKPTPTKARVCQPLSFSARVNTNINTSQQNVIANKKDNITVSEKSSPAVACDSPAAERKSVTTVPQVNIVRDETPGVFNPVNVKSTTSESLSATSQENNKKSTSVSSENGSSSSTIVHKVSLKRKNSQTDITEYFNIKKSRNLLAAGSVKRKLDL